MTDVLDPSPDGLTRAADILRLGGLVAFPTDTVYGVGVAWSRPDRLPAIFELKRRSPEKRIPVLLADLGQASTSGFQPDHRAERLAARFWPGPLTLVLPGPDGSASVAFRAPNHAVALALIAAAGPLLATSANVSGEPDTLGAEDVLVAFATQRDLLDAVVDGGRVPGGVPSTLLDLSVTPARVLRDGPISRAQLVPHVELEGSS
ncbi:MAG: L-threonylcarbamoyladenylate synthase [Candidatus Limnocylindria bacterium]